MPCITCQRPGGIALSEWNYSIYSTAKAWPPLEELSTVLVLQKFGKRRIFKLLFCVCSIINQECVGVVSDFSLFIVASCCSLYMIFYIGQATCHMQLIAFVYLRATLYRLSCCACRHGNRDLRGITYNLISAASQGEPGPRTQPHLRNFRHISILTPPSSHYKYSVSLAY